MRSDRKKSFGAVAPVIYKTSGKAQNRNFVPARCKIIIKDSFNKQMFITFVLSTRKNYLRC